PHRSPTGCRRSPSYSVDAGLRSRRGSVERDLSAVRDDLVVAGRRHQRDVVERRGDGLRCVHRNRAVAGAGASAAGPSREARVAVGNRGQRDAAVECKGGLTGRAARDTRWIAEDVATAAAAVAHVQRGGATVGYGADDVVVGVDRDTDLVGVALRNGRPGGVAAG